jgi:hypothetical protein
MLVGIAALEARSINMLLAMTPRLRKSWLFFCAAVSCWFLFFAPPIPQDNAYHLFVDNRTIAGVPNFWNVVSNLPSGSGDDVRKKYCVAAF